MKTQPLSRPDWAAMLKKKRLELGESQEQFGLRFNVTLGAVSHWESGTRNMPVEVAWWLHEEALARKRKAVKK